MGVRVRLTIDYDWDATGDEISPHDLLQETHDWITHVLGETEMLKGHTNPTFNVERVAS